MKALLSGLVAGVLGLGLSMSSAMPAMAADELRVSDDGVTFSSSYPGTLFGSSIRIIPRASAVKTFYVRNTSPNAAYLRISLRNVDASDPVYAEKLSVSTSVPGYGGTAQPLSAANSCIVLLDGPKLASGATVAVSAVVALADLEGQQSQGSMATFSVHVALSDVLPGVLAPTACSYAGITIPGTPDGGQPGVGGNAPATPTDYGFGSAPEGSAPEVTVPETVLPSPLPAWLIDPNTGRLYEELFWFVMLGAFILGGIGFFIVAKRRRRGENENSGEAAA